MFYKLVLINTDKNSPYTLYVAENSIFSTFVQSANWRHLTQHRKLLHQKLKGWFLWFLTLAHFFYVFVTQFRYCSPIKQNVSSDLKTFVSCLSGSALLLRMTTSTQNKLSEICINMLKNVPEILLTVLFLLHF